MESLIDTADGAYSRKSPERHSVRYTKVETDDFDDTEEEIDGMQFN